MVNKVTIWMKEMRLEVTVEIGGARIPTVNRPKILIDTFDSLLSF